MVARLHRRHAISDSLDDASPFVTDDAGKRKRRDLGSDAEIRMAQAGRDDANEDFVAAQIVEFHLGDLKWLVVAG